MLRRWLDACIVCAKPNGKDAYLGQVRFTTLRETLLGNIRCFAITGMSLGRNYLFEHWETPLSVVAR